MAKTTLFAESDFVNSEINFHAKRFETGSIDAVGSSRIAIEEFKSDNKSETFLFCPPESVEICSSSLFEMASLEASVWMRIGSEEGIFSSSSSLFLALRLFEENANRNRKCSRTVSCGHKKSNCGQKPTSPDVSIFVCSFIDSRPTSTDTKVVFPAPLCPSNAQTLDFFARKLTFLKMRFVTFVARMASSLAVLSLVIRTYFDLTF